MKNFDIDVCFTPSSVPNEVSSTRMAAVIDVMRATSTICSAFAIGMLFIKPVSSIEEAIDLRNSPSFGDWLLMGERGSRAIDGFDYENSPLDVWSAHDRLKGRSGIMTTTNGTLAMLAASHFKNAICSSFINLSASARFLTCTEEDGITIICAGRMGYPSLDDTICAGALVKTLLRLLPKEGLSVRDSARIAMTIYETSSKNILDSMRAGSGAKCLLALGKDEDIRISSSFDLTDKVPVLRDDPKYGLVLALQ